MKKKDMVYLVFSIEGCNVRVEYHAPGKKIHITGSVDSRRNAISAIERLAQVELEVDKR